MRHNIRCTKPSNYCQLDEPFQCDELNRYTNYDVTGNSTVEGAFSLQWISNMSGTLREIAIGRSFVRNITAVGLSLSNRCPQPNGSPKGHPTGVSSTRRPLSTPSFGCDMSFVVNDKWISLRPNIRVEKTQLYWISFIGFAVKPNTKDPLRDQMAVFWKHNETNLCDVDWNDNQTVEFDFLAVPLRTCVDTSDSGNQSREHGITVIVA